MGELLVSVLVPAYKAEAFIGPCLRSVLDQSYPNLEIVVLDDCSPDATFEVAVESLRGVPNATVRRHDVNLGHRDTFRQLLATARGSLVKFVCNDDLLAPHAISRLAGALIAHPEAGIATSRRTPIDASGAALPVDHLPQPPCSADSLVDGMAAGNDLLCGQRNWIGEPTTVLFRRELLPLDGVYEIGGRAPARNIDVVWWLKILAQGRLAVINEHLSSFRLHTDQISRTTSRAELVLAWQDIILGARNLGFLAEADQEILAWAAFAQTLQANVDTFDEADRHRSLEVIRSVAARLGELCPA
ncbi:MAG TPA: glycosyltransferase family A protein [Acidimicrobiales bacterium]|nr:glycosyltransferase family A protein [Acidimicrobiales bacterium]